MAAMAGVLVAISIVASPSHGALAAWRRHRELARSLAAEDMLGVLGRAAEIHAGGCDEATLVAAGGGNAAARRGFASLRQAALIAMSDGKWMLTAAGVEVAREILSRHRGWQEFLVTRTGMSPDHAHEAAHRLEHLAANQPRDRG
jgi:hypothetical protein